MKKPHEFNILIVDDEASILELLAKSLSLDGYNTFVASGGREAIKLVQGTRIDFIISDVRMPEGDGIELLTCLRKINTDIPVIVLVTGHCEISKSDALKMGAKDLIPKPIDMDLLEKHISECLAVT